MMEKIAISVFEKTRRNWMIKKIGCLLLFSALITLCSAATAANAASKNLVFQLHGQTLLLNSSDICSIKSTKNAGNRFAINLILTKQAAIRLEDFTRRGINHVATLSFNNHVISRTTVMGALSGNFQLANPAISEQTKHEILTALTPTQKLANSSACRVKADIAKLP